MFISISIFDFFSHTIPGSLYLFTIIYSCYIFDLFKLNIQATSISLTVIILLAVLSYLLGLVFRPLAHTWYYLFRPKKLIEKVLIEFKQLHPDIKIKFEAKDWAILLSYIREKYDRAINDIEKNKAINIMLRGVSLNLMVISLIQLFQYTQTNNLFSLISGLFLIFLSILAIVGGIKFDKWFYLMIFETTLISEMPLDDFLNTKRLKKKKNLKETQL